ncbi:hypothetical protein BKA62DRAFT_736915 [Auriculariales sp. MPI-PUGE-AT-0066]|nr:hypothetical protein BKA62DRAFT_736915 [Auriculariales sp. MPI-PUGE-AT-0066]
MESLPNELVAYIFQTAAYLFRFTDRNTVVRLALTSSFIYDIVAPILYEQIFISSHRDEVALSALLIHEVAAASVLKHVRFLYTGPNDIFSASSVAALFTAVNGVYGSIKLWDSVASAQMERGITIATDLRAWTVEALPDNLRGVDQQSLRGLTRLHSFIPFACTDDDFLEFFDDIAGWTRNVLELVPSLTHLGFSYVNPGLTTESTATKDLEVFSGILRAVAASKQPCVQIMALRIAGQATSYLDAYLRVARTMDEDWAMQRMHIWADYRNIGTWTREIDVMGEDGRKGRSIWTEAKSVRWHVEAQNVAVS